MRTLETNDWLTLNSIIYKIYTTESPESMREQLLEQLKMIVDFDSAEFYLAGEDENAQLCEPVLYNCDEAVGARYQGLNYNRNIMDNGKCLVYRETDVLADEKRVDTEYYQKIYAANSWHYALQMVLGRERKFLGVITLYRTIGKDNFVYDDIFILDLLKEHLAYRLSREHRGPAEEHEKFTVTQAAEEFDLTRRELDILKHLMAGMDNNDICEELTISVNTLKKHILNIYRKLGINNRVQLFKMIKERE